MLLMERLRRPEQEVLAGVEMFNHYPSPGIELFISTYVPRWRQAEPAGAFRETTSASSAEMGAVSARSSEVSCRVSR